MRSRTAWLFDIEPAAGPVALADGTVAALLTSANTTGIAARFVALIEQGPVDRLIVLSPYWDQNLSALKYLIETLNPAETIILIDAPKALFPANAMQDLSNTAIFDLQEFGKHRFIHAKAIIAETSAADHVLYGSANCTIAALGTQSFAGDNEEACLYRRLPPNTLLEALHVANVIATTNRLLPTALPAYLMDEDLPLSDAAKRSPGRFECMFDTLAWWPPASAARPDDIRIELLGADRGLLRTQLTPMPTDAENRRRFQVTGTADRPAFARLGFADGSTSAPAVVMVVDTLRETIREPRSRRAESVALRLSEETQEGLWLWEALNDLEMAQAKQNDEGDPGSHRTRQSGNDIESDEEFRILNYERFIAGRRIRSDITSATRDSLAGSELSLVRNFLNRILSIHDHKIEEPSDVTIEGLNLGDETANAEQALERGEEFATPAAESRSDRGPDRQKAAHLRATHQQIVQAVERFNEHIREAAETGQVTSFDVLRLRVILTIAAAAGQSADKRSVRLTSLQVLRLDNSEGAWPRLMGRVLFTFFGGPRPAIRYIEVKAIYDQIPDDIVECWATAFWASQACVNAATKHKVLKKNMLPILIRLAQQLYARTGLRRDDLESQQIVTVLDKLSTRFATRLGLDPEQIRKGHSRVIREIHAVANANCSGVSAN
jgi:hypothetical protein